MAPGAGDSPWTWNSPPPDAPWPLDAWTPDDATAHDAQAIAAADDTDRAAALIAAGAGRRRLSRELGVTEYEARRLLDRARPTTDTARRDDTDDTRPTTAAAADAAATAPTTAGARS